MIFDVTDIGDHALRLGASGGRSIARKQGMSTRMQVVRSAKIRSPTYQLVGARQILQCVGQIKIGSSAQALYQTPSFRRHGKPNGIMPVLSSSPTSRSQSSGASSRG